MSEVVPLEERNVRVQYNGVWSNVPALHKTWATEDRAFPRYVAPPVPDKNNTFPIGSVESWIELISFIQDDLKWLLRLSYHVFWSQVVFNKSAVICINSFLQEAPPAYSAINLSNSLITDGISETSRLVFLVFCRLSTREEDAQNFMSQESFAKLLYDNYIFTIPGILDICSIYGLKNTEATKKIIQNVITSQPAYMNDLSTTEPHLMQILNQVKDKCKESNSCPKWTDFMLHTYDALATMEILLNLFPQASSLFATSSFLACITSFYSTVIPILAKKEFDVNISSNIRINCLKFVHHILAFVVRNTMNSQKVEDIELYLTLISEIMSEEFFICDYHAVYPLDVDLDIIVGVHPEIDSLKINYIFEALSSYIDIPKISKKPNKPVNKIQNYPSTSSKWRINETNETVTGVKLESLITEVQDVLPHLGSAFVNACLEYYDYNTERVIAAILENSLPAPLEERNWIEEKGPALITETDYMTAHKGKRRSKYKNLNQMLSDKTEIDDLRDRFSTLGYVEDDSLYDDEYDDTYESHDIAVREVDDPGKMRRPFVVPRVLRQKSNEESDESENEQEEDQQDQPQSNGVRKDIFIQNPEELRARAEAKRAEKRRGDTKPTINRDVVGKPKGQGQEQQVLNNRNKKNINKSSGANHHRRDRAAKKRNQGLGL